jgi:intermembrane space import and assembly protein 40
MAHGPCGEEFRAAFSCFVYSKDEPKGVDCIDKFKGMQDCFRAHPDVYGAELEDDEEPLEGDLPEGQGAPAIARDGEPLEAAAERVEDVAANANEKAKVKVTSVKDDIKQDADALKSKVEDKLQEARSDVKDGQEKAREVARDIPSAGSDAKNSPS